MKKWTTQAEQRLTEYLTERAAREGFSGEDAAELKADLVRHVHEETERLPEATVSLLQLENLLGRLDAGYRPVGREPANPRPRPRIWSWLAGVILPLGVLLFESLTRFCGGVFFDPVPTWWHFALIASVPVLNGGLLLAKAGTPPGRLGLAAGFSLGVAGFYALLFLPLVHLSVLALVALGMGFLSLIPIFAGIQSWWIGRGVLGARSEPGRFRSGRRWGIAAAAAALCLLEGPGVWTRINLHAALAETDATTPALARLRAFHSERTLLKACYEGNRGTSMATDISGWITVSWQYPATALGIDTWGRHDSERVRDLFFRVTGKPFNSLPPPSTRFRGGRSGRGDPLAADVEFDSHTGGDAVAVRIRDLDLTESRLDGHLDGVARLGYAEWTMVFKNGGRVAREARCQVRLPADGRVSRLTLWVNGSPQEAAFSTVAKVKAAYREVAVVRRQDPVLVTMVAPDTVMVQCFPVPAQGEMKIRFGITAPLTGTDWELPRIIERNYGIAPNVEHAIWLQGDRGFTLTGDGKPLHSVTDGPAHSLSAAIAGDRLAAEAFVWSAEGLAPTPETVWCEDTRAAPAERFLIREPAPQPAAAAVVPPVVVIDGSLAMAEAKTAVLQALQGLGTECQALLLADDTARQISPQALADYRFSGGRDNEPALREAVRLAKAAGGAPIVWLHGPQPVSLAQTEALLQLLERGSVQPRISDCEVAPGPNRLVEAIFRSGCLHRLSAPGKGTIRLHAPARPAWNWRRAASPDGLPGQRVSDHLARLWASAQVESSAPMETRSAIGARYQLVTPVSGAVVLETAAQYAANGLTPGDPSASPQVPAIPEPASALLILLTVTAVSLRRRRAA